MNNKRMRTRALIFVLALFFNSAQSQEVIRVTWPTTHASPPATIPNTSPEVLAAIRLSLFVLSESNAVDMAMGQSSSLLGIPANDASRLRQLFGERYRLIQNDPVFRDVPSALPYCFSANTPTEGLALVYFPKKLDTNAPSLIFLHGYGGSFLWSQQLLAEAFPNRLIICPAFGIGSASMPSAYLSECLQAVRKKVGQPVKSPILIGLSAGGFGAARIITRSSDQFNRLIVLAAYPPEETLTHFDKRMSVRFLVGAKEDYVQSGLFARDMQSIRSRVTDLQFQAISDTDHFFLLAKREETLKILRSWIEFPVGSKPISGK